MILFKELRQRRVFQITSAYVVGGWGLLQFLAFLEDRMAVSPHLVNLVGLGLLLLIPSVVTLAWVHGRPGKDPWGRAPRIVVPTNLLAAALLLAILFNGRDLGAVTRTIAVEDEEGTVTQRVVPKNEFRRRVLVLYPETPGAPEDAWAGETLAYLLGLDVNQDIFVEAVLPLGMEENFRELGSPDGHGLSRPQHRKLAREARIGHFLTGSLERFDGRWRLTTELNESDSGRLAARRESAADDLFQLVDQVSRQLREDLDIPAAHLDESPDLPIAELTSTDLQAVAEHVRAWLSVSHGNDWPGAVPHLEEAVRRDPTFALAHFLHFAVLQTLGDAEGSSAAIESAMEHLYRVPERLGFMIKTQYYYNEKQDADKAMAVLRMWTQLYPDDVTAYEMQALFYFIRQDLPGAIASYEQVLLIDPSRVDVLEELADLHTQHGEPAEAEKCLQRLVEIFPGRAVGYESLSDFYSSVGRLDEARETLAKARLLEPDNLDLTLSLIDLDIKAAQYGETQRKLADLLTEDLTARDRMRILARQMQLAHLQGRVDDLADRIDDFYAALLETRNPLEAHIAYSVQLAELTDAGRPQEVLRRLEQVKSQLPVVFRDLVGAGEARADLRLGRLDEARAELATAAAVVDTFKFETYRPILALVEGMIDEADGDLDAAVAHYREAMSKALRNEPVYRFRLARALRLTGAGKEARDLLREGLKTEPTYPWFLLELAHLAHERGGLREARTRLEAALDAWAEASPEFPPAREARELAESLGAD